MNQPIRPVPYTPPPPPGRTVFRNLKPGLLLTLLALATLVGVASYVFTARAVQIDIEPLPDSYAIRGGLLNFKLGERHLLRPGTYQLQAEKAGYRPLQTRFVVERSSNQVFDFALEKLPGLVSFNSAPVDGASVFIDDQLIGTTPLSEVELTPGEHTVRLEAERYRVWEQSLEVAGANARQRIDARLLPAWAELSVSTEPANAELRIDGELLATTPAAVEVLEGQRQLEISLSGYKTIERKLDVVAGNNQSLDGIRLEKSDGRVALDSNPRGANVTVGGIYRGQTPLRLALAPGRSYEIQFSRAGYKKATRTVAVRSGEGRSLAIDLEAEEGIVNVSVLPRDSRVLVNGEPVGTGSQSLVLPAIPHQLRVEREGFAPFAREITPRPGFDQDLPVTLRTLEQARYDALKPTISTAAGQTLKLIRPGNFRMGASRREPGRRANEVIRRISLTQPYYVATTEVTNEQFRMFDSQHESGIVGRSTLNLEKAPVVNITWEQAARYCNWLSTRDGLQPAYEERDGALFLKRPAGTGYRLLSEAEWIWAGRGDSLSKFPWGQSMPPAAGAGNFADDSARPVVARVIAGINDGHAATAPVGSFPANERGLHDFAGNVAEWVNDFYAVNPGQTDDLETDPLGPTQGDFHVVRGSSWKHSTITELRWSFRDYAAEPRNDIGFRIARYAD